MKISGVVLFQRMNASAINLIREFQRNHADVRITFSASLSDAKVEWESLESLALLTRLAASVQSCDRERERGDKHERFSSRSRSLRP